MTPAQKKRLRQIERDRIDASQDVKGLGMVPSPRQMKPRNIAYYRHETNGAVMITYSVINYDPHSDDFGFAPMWVVVHPDGKVFENAFDGRNYTSLHDRKRFLDGFHACKYDEL